MLQRLRERLALVLLCLLPFHALLVTVGTKLLLGPGHAPMPLLAGWKEALLAVILLIAVVEFLRKPLFTIDLIDGLIITLLVIALLLPKTNFLFGFKYDFVPLIAFITLRRVEWSQKFLSQVQTVLLWVGCIVAAYGVITLALPDAFFRMLGYSDAHSLYLPNGPLAAFQQISGTGIRRIQSVMSGPNQFGIWLLIPLSIAVSRLLGHKRIMNYELRITLTTIFILLTALLLTFSRSAWIAAFVIVIFVLFRMYSRKFTPALFAGSGVVILLALLLAWISPSIFVRSISLAGHIERPLQAMQMIREHPFGLGLGSAGPASNRVHEPCVFLEPGDDPSWAESNPALCVFVGKTQVQPAQPCDCPLIPENWYLQIGVELGILGFILYGMLIAMVLWRLKKTDAVFLAFLGISIAGLFLHAWEDAAVAYTGWVLVATHLGRQFFEHH